MFDKYENKSCFYYEWMSYAILTKKSTYLFTSSLHSFNICWGARCSSVVRAFAYADRSFMVDPLSYFAFQPELHDWCNKGRGMCYPVYGMMYIKEPLLLIEKSSSCGGSGFPLSLFEWSFTIYLTLNIYFLFIPLPKKMF